MIDFVRSLSNDDDAFHDGLRPITMQDFTTSLTKMKTSRAYCNSSALVSEPVAE